MAAIPKRSGVGGAFAEKLASDSKRLAAAIAYWKERLQASGETVMETGTFSSSGMKLAQKMPRASYDTLLKEFRGFFDSADEGAMISTSGCLTSLKDLASVTGVSEADIAKELQFLGGFDTSEKPKEPDQKRLAVALLLAREVFDMTRRFTLCSDNSRQVQVPCSELLAIYQQEGALGIAPPKSSWEHGPLISTTAKGCRTHDFHLWETETTRRDSYVLSHDRASAETPSENNPVSLSFGLAVRHMTVIAGIDTIVGPGLAAEDELLRLFTCIRAQPSRTFETIDALKTEVLSQLSRKPSVKSSVAERQASIGSQQDMFDGLCLGLITERLESTKPDKVPGEAQLQVLHEMERAFHRLLDAHPGELEGGRVFLAPGDDSADARSALELQASWFASRKQIHTLLAWRDRADYKGPAELAPILAYLRYNVGEFNFMRMLIFFAHRLAELKKPAARKDFELSEDFVAALARVPWTPADAQRARSLLDAWQDLSGTPMFNTPGWLNVGLIKVLDDKGEVCTKDVPPSKGMPLAADAALVTVTVYVQKGLFDLLALFVLSHPLRVSIGKLNVVALKREDSLQPMRNAFSFERMRRVNALALKDAGLREIAPAPGQQQPVPVTP